MSAYNGVAIGFIDLRRLCTVLSLSSLLFSAVTFAEEQDQKNQHVQADAISFDERYAQRLQFHRTASLALDRAQARLEQEGFTDVADRRRLGYSRRPMILHDLLPFHIREIDDTIPLALFLADSHASQGMSRNNMFSLMESFNIQVHGNIDTIAWPDSAILEFSLHGSDESEKGTIQTTMRFDSATSSYYFEDSFDAYQSLMNRVLELTNSEVSTGVASLKPTLTLVSLTGFEALAAELEPIHFPRGVSITHSVRLGEVRLSTDFSWLGRPRELLALASPQFLQ